MKTTQNNLLAAVKKTYVAPQIDKVALDNEISMVMMSGIFEAYPEQDPLITVKRLKLFK
ncbi:MAG: hypothetical protein RLZZ357_1654 [Bacteroidota bacterium]|jgi:hypothetical protein